MSSFKMPILRNELSKLLIFMGQVKCGSIVDSNSQQLTGSVRQGINS